MGEELQKFSRTVVDTRVLGLLSVWVGVLPGKRGGLTRDDYAVTPRPTWTDSSANSRVSTRKQIS